MTEQTNFSLFNKKDTRNFMRLLKYLTPYKIRIVWALLAIMVVAATESYLAAFIAPLVNQGFAAPQAAPVSGEAAHWYGALIAFKDKMNYLIWGTEQKIWAVPLFLLVLVALRGIGRFSSGYLLSWVGIEAIKHLRQDMFDKMLHLSSEKQQAESSGNISSRFLVQANIAISNASDVFITVTRDSLIVAGLVCVLLYLNWQLSLVVVVMFPLLLGLSRYYRNRLKEPQIGAQTSMAELTTVINELHQGHRIVKLFGGYQNALDRFTAVNQKITRINKKIAQASSARSPISEFIASAALAVVIFIALWQSRSGATNGTQTIETAKGSIRFEHIDVRYPGQENKALDDFTLHIRPGEKVAMVGRSGSGKTTAINLLPRFITPESGRISLDGIDIGDLTLESLRKQFALVSQDVFLFDDTLYNNVLYGCLNADADSVERALKASNLWDFVRQNPQGWDMEIGANGHKLSGGQRQRGSIARAILKDAPILLLDEATSALDNESERLVQQALERLMHGRTSIIVAHRLTTIEQSDRIIVMSDGRIIEEGTHKELLEKQGYYAELSKRPETA